ERADRFGDALVVDRFRQPVMGGRASGVAGQLEIDHEHAIDPLLPVVRADGGLDAQALDEDRVGHVGGASSDRSQRARAASAPVAAIASLRRAQPAYAIIAALSVQNSGRGKYTLAPRLAASATRRSRSRRFAPTPPATTSAR